MYRSLTNNLFCVVTQRLAVCLEPDVAEIFPNSQAVNEALRFLMRVTKENRS
jgi:hypothetical protein